MRSFALILSMTAPVPPLLAAGLRVRLEDDDLGVLSAELDHRSALRIQLFDGERDRIDLLDELRAQELRHPVAARAGDEHPRPLGGKAFDLGFKTLQEFEDFLRLLGVVPVVVLPEDLVGGGIDDDGFHRGRTDVQADEEVFVHC
jgi:hypothetical protein